MKTDENLMKNFAAEAMSVVKAFAYARIADREGHRQVAKLFRALAEAELVHAINTLRIMGELEETSTNLAAAIDGKTYDYTQRYPTFMAQSDRDGHVVASNTFQGAVVTSKAHIRLLNEALNNFKRNKDADYWVCGGCGFIETGEMPASCRTCGGSREKFTKTV